MDIKHISICNFRGIRSLEWSLDSRITCLLGPCDSNKTTILDAIEYCLYPWWNLSLDDSDFYMTDPKNEILIKVTIGDLPKELLTDQKFGLFMRGWSDKTGLNDEPKAGDDEVLTVSLSVPSTLEPKWSVTNNRSDGKAISHSDRAILSMNRLTSFMDSHLSWRRGSILSRLTEGKDAASVALVSAGRNMRDLIDLSQLGDFTKVAETATNVAGRFGVKPKFGFTPRIDPKAISTGTAVIGIHDGPIPLRAAGLGTKRLVALALQMNSSNKGSIVLVDEVEEGLEPFRLRHLLRQLTESDDVVGQVIMTTHSPIATVELPAEALTVVRVNDGKTVCRQVPLELQATARAVPEALLARSVLVCEGKTEYGLVRGMDRYWERSGLESFTYRGTVVVEGGGTESPKRSQQLSNLGYRTALFVDSDKLSQLEPSIASLEESGVAVVHWAGAVSTEQRLATDLPTSSLQLMLDIRKEDVGLERLRDSLRPNLPFVAPGDDLSIDNWINAGRPIDVIREAIGLTARNQHWFKRIDLGFNLARLVSECIETIPETDLYDKLNVIRKWVHS